MVYGLITRVRYYCKVEDDDTDVTDAEIIDALGDADVRINLQTGRDEWTSADYGWDLVQDVSAMFAAADIMLSWDERYTPKANSLYNRAKDKLNQLIRGYFPDNVESGTRFMGVTSYATNQLNEEVEPFESRY